MNKIIIGSDHAGFELKEKIKEYLNELDYKVEDLGTNSAEAVDYPVYGKKVAEKVAKTNSTGILVCGSGIGICMSANKIKGIRAALCYDEYTAKTARQHNNANIICLGARTPSAKNYKKIIKTFLTTEFSKEQRHHKRVKQMDAL
jgi:ribose 5-phosphate isomerase B